MQTEKGLRYFPIALFASVMGVSGLAMSLRLVENVYGISHIASAIITILATIMFLVNITMLFYRLAKHRDAVKIDFKHPVRMNFFAAISISLLLLGTLFYEMNMALSLYTWMIGAALQFILTLLILSALIWERELQLGQFNPAWFIPIVGNIVVPLAGVYHAPEWLNWMFFGIGLLFSIIYFTIFMNRIYFQPALPVKLLPTFFILLAPPGIGFVSYVKLTGQVDVFAYMMFGIAFYLGLLFIYQIRRFISIPFFISWWAFLFPSAAVTNATIYLHEFTQSAFLAVIYHIQVLGLIVLTIYLFARTIGLVAKGQLCVKED